MDSVRPELLISRLAADNESWRLDAETRLIAMGEAALPQLIRSLRHANPAVRMHAVHALSRIGNAQGLKPVIEALAESENQGAVAIAAEKALVEWGEAAKKALIEEVQSHSSPARARALRALSRIGGADLTAFLASLLNDSDARVRAQAAVGLTTVAGPSSVTLVVPLLQDADKWVRYEVAEALVKIGSDRGEAVLEQAKLDPEEQGTHLTYWADDLLDEIGELRRTGRVWR